VAARAGFGDVWGGGHTGELGLICWCGVVGGDRVYV